MKEKQSISAEIIADSINEQGNRITTFVLVFPRIVLAEFNTHRMFSRNSASSRAIPFEKMLERVETDPFIPIKWMKDHPGMQGNEYFLPGQDRDLKLEENWLEARDYAIKQAKFLSNQGLTKQIVNRLLEPFLWHTVIVTSTDYENFFALRAHEAAEIHIQELAHIMLEKYNESKPKELKQGEWHIPFGDKIDENRLTPYDDFDSQKIKIATARCARVSYMNFDGSDDYEKDIQLYDRLSKMGHWSPFEHCAEALDVSYQSGNFEGWSQLRKRFTSENKTDNRVKK